MALSNWLALWILSDTPFSWRAYPFTVSTRLGIRSARRCSWFSTWLQAASTCCSSDTMRLYPHGPQPAASATMRIGAYLRMRIADLPLDQFNTQPGVRFQTETCAWR